MKIKKYFDQAKLMLSVLPIVGQEKDFERELLSNGLHAIVYKSL